MLIVSRPYANMIWGHSWGACVWNARGKRRILFVRMKRDDWREPDVKRRKRRKRNLVHRSASEEQLGPSRTSFHFEQWSRVETTLVQTTRIASRRRVTSVSILLHSSCDIHSVHATSKGIRIDKCYQSCERVIIILLLLTEMNSAPQTGSWSLLANWLICQQHEASCPLIILTPLFKQYIPVWK